MPDEEDVELLLGSVETRGVGTGRVVERPLAICARAACIAADNISLETGLARWPIGTMNTCQKHEAAQTEADERNKEMTASSDHPCRRWRSPGPQTSEPARSERIILHLTSFGEMNATASEEAQI